VFCCWRFLLIVCAGMDQIARLGWSPRHFLFSSLRRAAQSPPVGSISALAYESRALRGVFWTQRLLLGWQRWLFTGIFSWDFVS